MKNYFYSALLLLMTLSVSAQKIEKESRIASEKVPQKALEYIFNATEASKVKWYYEINEKGNSYEAKYYLKKSKVSVEFDLQGTLQDVEIEINKSKMPATVKKSMRKYFKLYFNKYRLLKVQKQFKGSAEEIQKKLKDGRILTEDPTFYEIVVIGKKTDNVTATEFLFDNKGNLISSKKVIQNNQDNLTY